MKLLLISTILAAIYLVGCSAKVYHAAESRTMATLDPPICVGDDSIRPPDALSEFIYVSVPELIYEEVPRYPPECEEKRLGATVLISVYVDSTGNVPVACATSCDNPGWGFEEAAATAALKNKYNPSVINDRPIGQWIDYKIVFRPDP